MNNPYWERITKVAETQREKGLETYGQGLEENNDHVFARLNHIEEELIDALMYLEWLRDGLNGKRK